MKKSQKFTGIILGLLVAVGVGAGINGARQVAIETKAAEAVAASYDLSSSVPSGLTSSTTLTKDGSNRGMGKAGATYTLTTSTSFVDVTKVVVNAATNYASFSKHSISVTVGGTAFGSAANFSAKGSSTNYTITGSAKAKGVVVVSLNNSAEGTTKTNSIWVKSITVYNDKSTTTPTLSVDVENKVDLIANKDVGFVITANAENFTPTSYTWTSSVDNMVSFTKNDNKATVKYLKAGETTITVTASDGTNSAEATCALTVLDINHAGTAGDPFTVANAIAMANHAGTTETSNAYYVKGIVNETGFSWNDKYKSFTFYAVDEIGSEETFQFYGMSGDGVDLTGSEIGKYDTVVAYGKIKMYSTTAEFNTCKYVSSTTPVDKVTVTVTEDTIFVDDTGDIADIIEILFESDSDRTSTDQTYTISSSNTNVISFAAGQYTAVGAGTAQVTVTSKSVSTVTDTVDVTVVQASATDTIAAINNIGTVAYTTESYAKIVFARASYDALTPTLQATVTNYSVLTTAETTFESLKSTAVSNTINLINSIGVVTINSKTAIEAAEAAYAGLLDGDLGKDLVTNYSTLTAARTAYDALAEQKAKADVVVDMIDALPDPETIEDYSHHKDIVAARKAYDALTEGEKVFVPAASLTKLENCELAELPYAPYTETITLDVDGGVDHTEKNHNSPTKMETADLLEGVFPIGNDNLAQWEDGAVNTYGPTAGSETSYPMKLGTSKANGSFSFTINQKAFKELLSISFEAYGWNGDAATFTVLGGNVAASSLDTYTIDSFTEDATGRTINVSVVNRVVIYSITVEFAVDKTLNDCVNFEEDYVHAPGGTVIAYTDHTGGTACLSTAAGGENYYADAMTEFVKLDTAARTAFNTESVFADARARLSAWAVANGLELTFNADGTLSSTPLVNSIFNGNSDFVATLIIVSFVALIGTAGFVLCSKKYKKRLEK